MLEKAGFINKGSSVNTKSGLIQSKMQLKMNTLKVTQDLMNRYQYWLSFDYDSTVDCTITVYYCAKEVTNAYRVPLYYTIPDTLPKGKEFELKKGKKKVFKDVDEACMNLKKYERMPIFKYSTQFYPLIITMQPKSQKGKGKEETKGEEKQALFTYAMFELDKENHCIKVKPIQQRFMMGGSIYELQQIFGIADTVKKKGEEGSAFDEEDEDSLCLICLSNQKRCIVMPCGHLCVCKDCALTLAQQPGAQCPICRNRVSTFVPLNLDSI